MNPPTNLSRVVNRKIYDVQNAQLLAGDDYWDGNSHERYGRNTFLYKSNRGDYFLARLTQWEDERDIIEPITQDDAITYYQRYLPVHRVDFTEAFPNVNLS